MTLDWNAFTPGPAFVGGLLIGLAAVLLLLLNGRIAGISGVLGGLLRTSPADRPWRVSFLLGLIAAPTVYAAVATLPQPRIAASNAVLIAAGLMVGLGTRYAGGCTSGHGVCGLSRFSLRSLVATMAFMAAGFATVFVLRHVLAG